MRRVERARVILLAVAVVAGLQPGLASGQAWRAPRTSWGHPDLQGIWSTATITPLERPAELAGKEFFTEQEVARVRAAGGRTDQSRSARRRCRRRCGARLQRLLVGYRHARRAVTTNRAHHRSARRARAAAHSRRGKAIERALRRRASSAVPQIIQRIAISGSAASPAAFPP